jgi:hypothetical protein
MSIAQHAERILAAWNVADPERFESELENAFHCCQKSASGSTFEIEQRELLESVVEQLRSGKNVTDCGRKSTLQGLSAQGLSAGFALLQHLSHRVAA